MKKALILLCAGILISCSDSTRFRLISSKRTGIDFNNTITETDSFHIMSYEYIYNGGGVGIGDLNNDSLPDIVFAGNQVCPEIYLNTGKFKFKNITANFDGLTNNQWFSSVSILDINCDGWTDVYFTSTADKNPEKCKNRLWINNGNGKGNDPTFTEMAENYGIAEKGQSVSAAFFDYDRDGDLDLYVLNNTVTHRMTTSYRKKINDGSALNNDRFYRNNGDGTFTDITVQAGIVFEGFGLGLAVSDLNKDGYPDLYISNDYISNDLLYINQGDGTFRNEIRNYISYQSKSSMGNDIADVNNDGNPDIMTLDMMPEMYYKKKQTINGFSYIFYVNDSIYDFEHQYLRNMLHLHNGFINGKLLPFSETGQMMGIFQTDWSWSPLFADYDNDGDKDLIITNGYPRDLTDKDWTKYQAKVFGFVATEEDVIDLAPAVKIPNNAFENVGGLKFIKRTHEWIPDIPTYSYGAAFSDLDNDGDLDYVVNNLNDKAFILRNYTIEESKKNANFIKISLAGKKENKGAIGAKIEIWTRSGYQFTENFLTRGYASSVDPVLHFGLGSDISIDSLKITWPAGETSTVVKNLEANKTIIISEPDPVPFTKNSITSADDPVLFRKVENAVNYSHEQADYIDFFYDQTIIPHKFSQVGPVMARGDIDGDDREDLIIGSTNLLPTRVYLRKGKEFVEKDFEGLTTRKEFSESDIAAVDIDNDGDKDIVAIAGGYENQHDSDYIHYLYLNNKGSFKRTPLPVPAFTASVVRPFDFNHDGFIDLFVGSRVKKGNFPLANQSWIIINKDGKLSTVNWSGVNLGMVTDACWSDYDNDGWEDLLIAREWNSIMVMKNMEGKELVAQSLPELEGQHGIWYSLISGDFDLDGDDDYIAGNLGDNHRFTVSDQYPLNLYAIDLDLDGIIDPVSTGYWKDRNGDMKEYPINYLDELWAQSALFMRLFRDYASFSYASIDTVLEESIMKRLQSKFHVNSTSSYFLWNDGGKFRWEKLPVLLQVSPIKKMIVQDFNQDDYPDILLTGNDYTYDIATGYYDANKGIILMGKGGGQFEVLPPSKSGLLIQGMVESLLYFEGESAALVVAGVNRAKVVTHELNLK